VAVLTAEEGGLVLQPGAPVSPAPGPQPWQPGLCGLEEASERGLVWPGLPLPLGSGAPSWDPRLCAQTRQDGEVAGGGLPSLPSMAAQGSATNPHMRGCRARPERRCQQPPSLPHPCLIWGLVEPAERVVLFPGPPMSSRGCSSPGRTRGCGCLAEERKGAAPTRPAARPS